MTEKNLINKVRQYSWSEKFNVLMINIYPKSIYKLRKLSVQNVNELFF